MNPVYAGMPTSIFEEMSGLARTHGAINLGQGFPDWDGPEDVRRMAAQTVLERSNQYPPMRGLPELRAAVADHYRRFQDLDLEPEEVLITAGATEAIAATLLALLSPGDEVLIIEPMYDAYRPLVERAGAVARYLRLEPPTWRLTAEHLARVASPSLRAVILNNPMNPAARIFSQDELALLADFCLSHDLIAICDEVWEHVVFDDRRHLPLIGLPGMRERTVKIGSAGKIFSMTGWKVGWLCAAPALLGPIARAHQYLTFTVPPSLQFAAAYGLGKDTQSFAAMAARCAAGRDQLASALTGGGFAVLPSEGTYFLNVDLHMSGWQGSDMEFCRQIAVEAGVAAIPLSPFYGTKAPERLIRLCFAKSAPVLNDAAARLVRFLQQARSAQERSSG